MEFDTAIGRRTAEMLAMPHLVCAHRACRRGPRCRFCVPKHGVPHCLLLLPPEEQACYDELYQLACAGVERLQALLGADPPFDAEDLALIEAALEISRASATTGRRRPGNQAAKACPH